MKTKLKPLVHAAMKTKLGLGVSSLGRKIGNTDVRCNLLREDSKWHTPQGSLSDNTSPDDLLRGLLYFTFEFRESRNASLMSATSEITLVNPRNRSDTIHIDGIYPVEALKPKGAPVQEIEETHEVEGNPKADTPFGGVQFGKVFRGSTSKSQVEKTYLFQSSRPSGPDESDNRAEFSWRRNTPSDWTGTDRCFHGALAKR